MPATVIFNEGLEGTETELKYVDELFETSYIRESGERSLYTHFMNGSTYTFSIQMLSGSDKLLDSEAYYVLNGERFDLEINPDGKSTESVEITLYDGDVIEFYGVHEGFGGGGGDSDVAGFNYVYRVDKEILRSIAGERFEVYTGDGTVEVIDLGEFILNVLELPFTISDGVLGEEKLVVLGNVTLETYATEILTDKLEVDLGSIDVPATYNNSYDYLNTTVTLHLPYVESIELEPDFVIGETVDVSYIINLYTGETTVNISSSKNEIIISRQVQIGREIPFMKAQSHEMMFSSRGSFGIDNKITTAFIEVSRNVPYKIDNAFDDNVVDYVQLKDVDGYVTVNEIKLETNATFQEKQEIKNILRNGVIIK